MSCNEIIKYPIKFQKKSNEKISNDKQHMNKTDDFELECPNYDKLPHVLPKVDTIIAIGDLHGDYKLAIDCLIIGKVINENLEWIGGKTIVVQIGDQFDRCRPTPGKLCKEENTTFDDENSDIKILMLFNDLHKKAKKVGGGVYSLLGNHEIMNVQGNLSYVSYKGLFDFKDEIDDNGIKWIEKINPETGKKFENGEEIRKYLFKRGNKYARILACTRLTALIIGSNLFVHAAILPKLAKEYNVQDLNIIVRKWLLKTISSKEKLKGGIGRIGDILINYELSPFWPRLLGNLKSDVPLDDIKCTDILGETLELYKCNNMIIGHTPQFFTNKSGISKTCIHNDNMGVWRIDTGSSKAFKEFGDLSEEPEYREPQILKITNDTNIEIIK